MVLEREIVDLDGNVILDIDERDIATSFDDYRIVKN